MPYVIQIPLEMGNKTFMILTEREKEKNFSEKKILQVQMHTQN